ncbi:MAG: 2-amino-4-hydroxy-6-hydroxymethyldihydropteridine diphosphokinase [Sandaracinaceae bacterium]|nr:2-amino-4-hydroxy-6-hydroxymethyldihydropteridine diphosphokinase [Sandaracinaceae bacterium]
MDFVVGLGSSLGSREAFVRVAARVLGSDPRVEVVRLSSRYVTAPVGPAQADFVNAAARVRTELAPRALLDALLAVEASLGRVRAERWGPRTIDLDLLSWEGGEVREPGLVVPHPRLRERAFALAPLLEVAPELLGELGADLAGLGAPPRAPGPTRSASTAGSRSRPSTTPTRSPSPSAPRSAGAPRGRWPPCRPPGPRS